MNQVQNLDFEYIVATDLAARGIDIEGVSHVINDAIPQDLSFFCSPCWSYWTKWPTRYSYYLYQPVMTRISVSWRNWESSLVLRWSKMGNFKIPMTVIVVPTVRKKQDKLDIEMIGLVKKKEKKSNRVIRRKFNGRLMKSAVKLSVLKIALAVVQSVKLNAKHFNRNCWSTELQLFFIYENELSKPKHYIKDCKLRLKMV